MRGIRILACIRLSDAQVANHLEPLLDHPLVERIHLVRHAPSSHLRHPKLEMHIADHLFLPRRLVAMYGICRRLRREGRIDAVVSFNPMPYGLVAIAATRGMAPYHLGFIGSDWYGPVRQLLWRAFGGIIRRASLVTTTGKQMREEIGPLAGGEARITILPHGIDIDRFKPAEAGSKLQFDLVYVGRLISIKRVDLIIRAVGELHAGNRAVRLCVVGSGPEREALERLAGALGVRDSVVFAGQADDVERYLRLAKVFVMASDVEGFPFAMVEAMCCGLVPVTTDAGTIRDHVFDGKNGFVVPLGDAAALAARVRDLLDDLELYGRLRARSLAQRNEFSFARAAEAWSPWLNSVNAALAIRSD